MEILQLKYFQHVARCENISHTAKEFFVPASSVSVSIKKLEKELGTELFNRTANSLKLNECGRIFLNAVDSCERDIRKAKTEMQKYSSLPTGEIRILLLTNRSRINKSIMEFKDKYPEVSFVIVHENFVGVSSYSEFDIIISDNVINSDVFEKRHLLREELCIAAGKHNSISSLKSVELKRLAEEKFVSMPLGTSLRDNFDRIFEGCDRLPRIAVECNDTFYIMEYVKKDMGVALFPKISWEAKLDDDISLVSIGDGVYRDTYIYTNKSSSDICSMFSEYIK